MITIAEATEGAAQLLVRASVAGPGAGARHEGPVVVASGAAAPIGQASARIERDHPHDHDRLW